MGTTVEPGRPPGFADATWIALGTLLLLFSLFFVALSNKADLHGLYG